MAIISDVNGKVARLGQDMLKIRRRAKTCRFRSRFRPRVKLIGRALGGRHLFYEMQKSRNFEELAQSVRWTDRN